MNIVLKQYHQSMNTKVHRYIVCNTEALVRVNKMGAHWLLVKLIMFRIYIYLSSENGIKFEISIL